MMRNLLLTLLLCVSVVASYCFATTTTFASNPQQIDVDSLGDIWIFTLDKSGSMLEDRTRDVNHIKHLTSMDIANQIMDTLMNCGILDCIDYSKDKITIFETGYGTNIDDSYGNKFNLNAPLKESFLHTHSADVYTTFVTYRKSGLYNRLHWLLQNTPYQYRESFVSQIRVLALAREMEYINEHELNNTFRKIHIVTITDDADDNDQWLKDYYSIKQRSLKKYNELNALQSKYLYNQLSQKGGGYMEEDTLYSSAKPMQKFKIHVYHYTTVQQQNDSIHFMDEDLIQCTPLNGGMLTFNTHEPFYNGDTISLIYLDEVVINDEHYSLQSYINEKDKFVFDYGYKPINNIVKFHGQIQVNYCDSIYRYHYRKIPFEQKCEIVSVATQKRRHTFLYLLIGGLCAFLIWIFGILPYCRLMTIYMPSGKKCQIRRGYKFRWSKSINPLAYIVSTKSGESRDVLAKHNCILPIRTNLVEENETNILMIDSSRPLILSQSMTMIDTTMEIEKYILRHPELCPNRLGQVYHELGLSQFDNWTHNQVRFMRMIGYALRKLYSIVYPHYFYWIDVAKIENQLVLRHKVMLSQPMFIENCVKKCNSLGSIDITSKILSQYYSSTQTDPANVLICINKMPNKWEWHVIQLQANTSLGHGISEVRKYVYYVSNVCDEMTCKKVLKKLQRAVKNELKCRRIAIMTFEDINIKQTMPFNVENNVFMQYIYLVEDTEQKRAIQVYSPLTDTLDSISCSKMIMLPNRKNHMEIYTSLIPFTNVKDLMGDEITRRESRDKYPSGPAVQGILRAKKDMISVLNMTIKLNY